MYTNWSIFLLVCFINMHKSEGIFSSSPLPFTKLFHYDVNISIFILLISRPFFLKKPFISSTYKILGLLINQFGPEFSEIISFRQKKTHNFNIIIFLGNSNWNKLEAPESLLYPWDKTSTYIKQPPFFQG